MISSAILRLYAPDKDPAGASETVFYQGLDYVQNRGRLSASCTRPEDQVACIDRREVYYVLLLFTSFHDLSIHGS